ncbi:aminopeptidase N [Loktanella sp. SALINAS62]|uniref:aminopeptidase N n=1 Tax=Loktanella sp. SALINAS62 TaxID=2706124 RepID=UPI001B8C05ED|nr:aminopeptidase N [Loktanella sp. SALINAS62]MBS1303788.1 aminopeptidase N [Loktanella sp. SALINAS62]
MKDSAPQTVHLADYTAPGWLVDSVHLTFHLSPDATRVISRIAFRPNPDGAQDQFFLHGEQLELVSAQIDGQPVAPDVTTRGLTCDVPDGPFIWQAEVIIAPADNTALEGLYMSGGMYCTQCEAEGFRKITYYPDRPDVMGVFTVRIESDMPLLLSNGNPVASGDGWAEWHDPWPKPAYLFALVAGDLVAHSDRFTTMENRDVALNIWVRPGDLDKCAFGMTALKDSMIWDERTHGRAYDLDIFNIVAVDDFNMGAMENKGLNIFNSSCVLAKPETSTDADFERIEAIIAHEYFHNWTGNRITCRDWFQLCLKEGLTVFRDQTFTGDLRGHAVKRIDDALMLRARQFREDAGPLAHPVRPASFVEINNFYTATVYEKGAELVGMLKRLVGDDHYRQSLDLYFDRHDGQAATIEDWLACFADVTGRDLSQFALWYAQAGTPQIGVSDHFADGTYTLTLTQHTPATPGQPDKQPLHIPVAVGLLAPDGSQIVPTQMLELTQASQTFTFDGLAEKPVPSILRDFSAPVILDRDQTTAERAFLLTYDTDPFNRWEAGRTLALDALLNRVMTGADPDAAYLDGLRATLLDDTLHPAFRARVLTLPSEQDVSDAMVRRKGDPDPMQIYIGRREIRQAIAAHLHDVLAPVHDRMQVPGPYDPRADDAGKRTLGNVLLGYLTLIDGGRRAQAQYADADNMTQQIAALACLLDIGQGQDALAAFRAQWQADRLVMDKWFGLQIRQSHPDDTVALTERLTQDPAFDWKNPNRFRSVFGSLAANPAGFHRTDGSGYDLLADWLIRLDPLNPQTTARMVTAFDSLGRQNPTRQAAMRAALARIGDTKGLSRDTAEMVSRILS